MGCINSSSTKVSVTQITIVTADIGKTFWLTKDSGIKQN